MFVPVPGGAVISVSPAGVFPALAVRPASPVVAIPNSAVGCLAAVPVRMDP